MPSGGVLVASALGYGGELAMDLSSVKLPRWRMCGGELVAAFLNKYLCSLVLWIPLLLLAGLGGEGEKRRGARLWELCGYPGDEADASSECKVLVIPGVPWWRSAASGSKRRFFMLTSRGGWWWRRFSLATLLRPAVAARGAVDWRVGLLGGWPGRCGGGGKMGGLWKQALWLCTFIELGVRRVATAGFAVYYNMWRCFLPRQWWYGGSGGD